jgi:hypothetical protein
MSDASSEVNKHLRTIFVFTCGVDENDIYMTVKSAYENARFISRIYFGIIDQRTDGQFSNTDSYKNVKKVNIDYKYPLGLGLGRLNAFMLHENQDYALQIDAHTIFDKNWDMNLLREISKLSVEYEKPAISNRPKWYTKNEIGEIHKHDTLGAPLVLGNANKLYESAESEIIGGMAVGGECEHYLTSGGFVFAKLDLFKEVMPDPRIAFYGEEHVLALRASARGWRFFAIEDSCLYSFGRHESIVDGTDDSWKKIYSKPLTNNRPCVDFNASINDKSSIVKQILDGDIIGYWGAPTKEEYEIYIQNLGFDYRSEKPIVSLADDVNPQ